MDDASKKKEHNMNKRMDNFARNLGNKKEETPRFIRK